MGRLTTHVLDTARGIPAKDLTIELWKHEGASCNFVKRVQTNDDGRVNNPLLDDAELNHWIGATFLLLAGVHVVLARLVGSGLGTVDVTVFVSETCYWWEVVAATPDVS